MKKYAMLAVFKAFRYTVFGESSVVSSSWERRANQPLYQGFFVICNATIASVAVWNMSIVQVMGWKRTLLLERETRTSTPDTYLSQSLRRKSTPI